MDRRPQALSVVDIDANVAAYLGDLGPVSRFRSFDYCFGYFQRYRDRDGSRSFADEAEIERSCLHLGWFLASWGMMRGSTILHERSLYYLRPVIETIAVAPREVWAIDADAYLDGAASLLLDVGTAIRSSFADGASDTLVTKVMLGVFGNIPAFDRNFNRAFGRSGLNRRTLDAIGRYYWDNHQAIDRQQVPLLDFSSGLPGSRLYPKAKVIDMVFWWEGR